VSERRYSEEEVAEILKQAAELEHSDTSLSRSVDGLTLSELEEIGREAGISPSAVHQAVRRIDKSDQSTRRLLGLPIGVSRTVELERKLTDDEWDRLVADLRTTFDARGRIRQDGSLRSWSNGNLQVLLEPSQSGQRLRLRTVKGNARSLISMGVAMFVVAAVWTIESVVKGTFGDPSSLARLAPFIATGTVMFGAGMIGLPRWAKLRRRQMDEIAERVESTTRTDDEDAHGVR
jgi:hypothetical protein